MNKFRFFLSALICMLSLSSAWAASFDYTDEYGITWTCDTYTTNGEIEAYVYKTTATSGNVVVPSSVDNGGTTYTVTSVGHPTSTSSSYYQYLFYNKEITSVSLPSTIRSIGSYAFSGCQNIENIFITNVAAWCNISGLSNLMGSGANSKTLYIDNEVATSIVIPEGPTTIPTQAFRYFKNITSVTIPNSVTSIGDYAFYGCSGLTSVEIGNSVTSIGNYAFQSCSGLTSVEIGNSVTSIGNYAFSGCSGLTSVEIPNSVTSIGGSAFRDCSGLTSVEIGNSVTSIGGSAFSGCSGLTSVEIGNSVTSISDYAFRDCSNIDKIYITDVAAWCKISGLSNLMNYGASTKTLYINNVEATDVVIPEGPTTIPSYAFYHFMNITSVSIPNSVTSVGSLAFCGCSGLTSVEIGSSVTSIGDYAFHGCSGLTSVEIPNSVTSIGDYTFYNCSGLTSVEIGNSVTSIGSYAFYGCSGLTSVVIPNSVTSIGNYAFQSCFGLTSITLPFVGASTSSFKNIGYLFGQSSNSSIPAKLKEVKVHGGNLVDNAFQDCGYLEKVTLGDGVQSVGNSAFSGCKMLKEITFGNNVQSIGASAFANCTLIREITIPASVTSIGSGAFNTVNDLEKITMLSETPATLGARDAITDFSLIYLPSESAIAKYEKAENWADHQTQFFCPDDVTEYTAAVEAKNDMSALHQNIGEDNLQKVVSLKVSGTINSYDLMIMRNKMVNLKHLDLSEATIVDNSYEYYQGYHSVANTLTRYALQPNLFSVKLPNSIIAIEPYALAELKHVDEIEIPANVGNLGEYAVDGLSYLKKLTFAEGSHLKTIGNYAFQNCSSLKELSIPASVTSIPNSSLFGCSALESFTLEDGVENIDIPATLNSANSCPFKNVYIGRNILTNYTYSGRLTSQDYISPFHWKQNLAKVTIGQYVKQLPDYLLYNSSCETLIVASSLEKINSNTFYGNKTKHIYIEDVNAWSNISGLKTLMESSYAKDMYLNGEKIETVNLTDVETMQKYAFCHTTVSGVFMPTNSELKEISDYAFAYSGLNKLQMPTSITKIGDYAFYSCPELTEVKLPSSIHFIGNYAFYGNPKLNDVYTYTIEPQEINQQTFSTYKTATLHCPNVSYYNYYYNTQWSQFLELVAFDEPYDYIFIDHDLTLDDSTGDIKGEPDTDINPGGGFICEGNIVQELGDVHIKFDGINNVGASFIGANMHANKIFLDLEVEADKWYYFSFPYPVNLETIQKSGGYVFRFYDGEARAKGGKGWQDLEAGTTHLEAGVGYIFRTDQAGTLSIEIDKKVIEENDVDIDAITTLNDYIVENCDDSNQSWNFVGNRYLSYYDINSLEYGAPIVIWDAKNQTYVALRPGDDEYELYPFQAFFVQKPEDVDGVGFDADARETYLQSQDETNVPKAMAAKARKAARLNPDRKLINLVMSNGINEDKTRVVFNEKQKLTFEAACDATKFSVSATVPQLFSLDDKGVKYSINERPADNGKVKLGYSAPKKGDYTISVGRMDAHVFIEDTLNGTLHDLDEGDYKFTTEAGVNENRFFLILADDETTAIDIINGYTPGMDAEGTIYDLSGRRVNNAHKGVVIKNGVKQVVK